MLTQCDIYKYRFCQAEIFPERTVAILQCFISNWPLWGLILFSLGLWRVYHRFWRVGLGSQRWPNLALKPRRITPLTSFTWSTRPTRSSFASSTSMALVSSCCTSAQTGVFSRSTPFKALGIPIWTSQRRQRFSGGVFARAAP